MVEPYATSLGGLTLAVNTDRFLVEHSTSSSVLSLHPGFLIAASGRPRYCMQVSSFKAAETAFEVEWQTIDQLRVTTTLELSETDDTHLVLKVAARNEGDTALEIDKLLPVCIPEEGPGALALGSADLRTLGRVRNENPHRLMRLHGDTLQSDALAAWFTQTGAPSAVLATLQANMPPPRFFFSGARGKLLGLRVECPGATLEPGETTESPEILLVLGDHDVREVLAAWKEQTGLSVHPEYGHPLIPEFHPGDPVNERPEEEEQPEEEPEELKEDPMSTEPEPTETQAEETSDPAVIEEKPRTTPKRFLGRKPAAYQKALHRTRGWRNHRHPTSPRWASGRAHEPLSGHSLRTRGVWRLDINEVM